MGPLRRVQGPVLPGRKDVQSTLLRSELAVLTLGDTHPGNILVSGSDSIGVQIAAIVDLEYTGFLPDYWECAQMARYGGPDDTDEWRLPMERTEPRAWDVRGIQKARDFFWTSYTIVDHNIS